MFDNKFHGYTGQIKTSHGAPPQGDADLTHYGGDRREAPLVQECKGALSRARGFGAPHEGEGERQGEGGMPRPGAEPRHPPSLRAISHLCWKAAPPDRTAMMTPILPPRTRTQRRWTAATQNAMAKARARPRSGDLALYIVFFICFYFNR